MRHDHHAHAGRRRAAARRYECDRCGEAMYEHHCKIVCPRCGYTRDCSDP